MTPTAPSNAFVCTDGRGLERRFGATTDSPLLSTAVSTAVAFGAHVGAGLDTHRSWLFDRS